MSPTFPSYLVPSLPFQRRKASTDSDTSTSSAGSSASSGTDAAAATTITTDRPTYLDGNASRLSCLRCLADLALSSQIISKGFTGRHGRAYLVSASESPAMSISPTSKKDTLPNLPNIFTHKPVPRQLVTGAHTVSDISCAQCGRVLGWKYVAAEEESQRYKVGKFILETQRIARSSAWEGQADHVVEAGPSSKPAMSEEVEFDSQDEDECEDLFMGVWTPQKAAGRRSKKAFSN